MIKKVAALVVLVMVASLCVAGCTVSIPGVSQSHVQAYVNALHDNAKTNLGPYESLRSWKDTPESADTVRVTWTIDNSSNGYTYTYDLRVKEFGSKDDASKFVDGMNSGYVSTTGSSMLPQNLNDSVYSRAMGHNPTIVDTYVKLTGIIPPNADVILQTNEFVVYGTVASLPGLSGTPASPTPIPSSQTTNGNNTTFSSGTGFNITYPTSLKADTTTDPTTQVKIYVYLNPSSVVDGVNVATVRLSAGHTLGSFVDLQMVNITKYPNYQEISNNATTVSGKPAQTIVFQATVPVQLNKTPASTTNTTLEVTETFVINNNTGYVITYKAVPSDYDIYLAQAEQIMNSFAVS